MRRAAAVAAAGLGLLLAALTFDAATLFVPAVALVLLALLSVAWICLAARGARIARVLGEDRVVEEQPVEARVRVTAGWFGLPGADVRDPLPGAAIAISSCRRRQTLELRVLARFPTRGRVVLRAPELRLRDGLGLVSRACRTAGTAQELLVLPRTERVDWRHPDGRAGRSASSGTVSPEPSGATEPDGLRAYRPGTPASRIHWPALARGAGLLERRLMADAENSPLVVLDLRGQVAAGQLDAAVRAAASLTLELARREGCDLLLPGERRPLRVGRDLVAWPGAHVRLALLQGGAGSPPPMAGGRPRFGAIFYVAVQPLLRPPVSRRADGPGVVLVLPSLLADTVRRPAVLEVAGCTGFLLGAPSRRARRAVAA